MRYPSGKQKILDDLSRRLDDLEKTTKMAGSYERIDPYIIAVSQGFRDYELIVFHVESKAWFDQGFMDYEAYNIAKRNFIVEGDTVFDLGCNIGYFSVLFGFMVGSEGRVEAFDPYPWNAVATEYNAKLNYLANVRSHAVGLGVSEASIKVHSMDSRSYATSNETDTFEIQIKPLAIFSDLRPSVMKIDIEGAEADLFGESGISTLGSLERFVMELHPHHLRERGTDPLSVLELFVREGFTLHAQDPLAHVFKPEHYNDNQQLYFGIRT